MLFGSFHQLKKVIIHSISIGEVSIKPLFHDEELGHTARPQHEHGHSYQLHLLISSLHLRNIARIRPFLSAKAREQLVYAFITSKLDMDMFGLHEYQVNRLQKIQNHAARLVTKTPGNMHLTLVLKHLHWLPIRQRVEYKLLHVYRALSGQGPSCMSDLVHQYIPARSLRSVAELQLAVPRTHSTFGDRAFSSAAPRLGNSLPVGVRRSSSLQIFKRRLKTYLFGYAFRDFWLF